MKFFCSVSRIQVNVTVSCIQSNDVIISGIDDVNKHNVINVSSQCNVFSDYASNDTFASCDYANDIAGRTDACRDDVIIDNDFTCFSGDEQQQHHRTHVRYQADNGRAIADLNRYNMLVPGLLLI